MIKTYEQFILSLDADKGTIKTKDGHTIVPDDRVYYMMSSDNGRHMSELIVLEVLPKLGFVGQISNGHAVGQRLTVTDEELNYVTYTNPDIAYDHKSYFVNAFRNVCYKNGFTMHWVNGELKQGKSKLYWQTDKIILRWKFEQGDNAEYKLTITAKMQQEDKSFSFTQDVGNKVSLEVLFRILKEHVTRPLITL